MRATAIALIVTLLMMLGSGCRQSRQLERATFIKSDSLVIRESVKVDTLIIPAARAEVVLRPQTMDHRPWTMDSTSLQSSVFSLPSVPLSGAEAQIIAYDRQGPATITVYRESDGALRAIATCDSVNRLLISTMSEQYRSGSTDREVIREKVVYQLPQWFRLAAIIVVAGVIVMILIRVKSIML